MAWHNHICKYRINDIFKLVNSKYYRNYHLASTSTSWDRYSICNDGMTSFRDVIPSCKYGDNNQLELGHQRNHRNEMKSALEHICRLGWRQFVFRRHVVILVTSWRHVMTWRHHAIHVIHLEPSNWNNYRNTCVSSLQNIDKLRRRSEFCDIMTSRHDVMTSCKHKNDNIFELGKPENYRNKKKESSL